MGLNPEIVTVIGADESSFGVDVLAQGGGESDSDYLNRLSSNAMLALDPQPAESITLQDNNKATGTKGQRTAAPGVGEAALTLPMELTGSADATNSPPAWVGNAKAAGMQVSTATRIPVTHQSATASAQRFEQGEQVFGPVNLTSGTWDDGDPSPSTSAPLNCVMYPDGETATSANAVSGLLYNLVSASPDVVLVRLAEDEERRPKSGWHIRVDKDGLGDYTVATFAEDMPVGVVVYPEVDGSGNSSLLWTWVAQGTFPQWTGLGAGIVGQKSGAFGGISSTPASVGTLLRPDSLQTLQLIVDNSNWTGADPDVNDQIVREDDPSNRTAAGQVIAFDADTPDGSHDTITVKDFWGTWAEDGIVKVVSTGSSTDLTQDAVQVRTPSRTFYTSVDGRRVGVVGARCQLSIEASAGEAATITFEAQGSPGPVPAMITQPTAAAASEIPPRWQNGVSVLNGHRLRTESMSMALNNELVSIPDANSPNGVAGTALRSRAPTVTLTLETSGTITKQGDFESAMRNANWWTAGQAFISDDGTRRIAIAFSKLQVQDTSQGGDSTMQHTTTFRVNEIQGDDDLFILVF